jgi:hypothetical protein
MPRQPVVARWNWPLIAFRSEGRCLCFPPLPLFSLPESPASQNRAGNVTGIGGDSRTVTIYEVDLNRPLGSWRAWLEARKRAGVSYRWHGPRHYFVTRLAECPEVREQTVRSLAGHVSNQVLQHHSHIRSHAKQAAIRAIETREIQPSLSEQGRRNGQSDDTAANEEQSNSENKWWARQDLNLGPTDYESARHQREILTIRCFCPHECFTLPELTGHFHHSTS